jgi:hypothetical protein
MKFRGKAVTGTSLLMMLGVVCFATTMVAALIAISIVPFNISQTVVAAPTLGVVQPSAPANIYTDTETTYTYSLTPSIQMTDVTVTLTVTKTGGYESGNITGDSVTVTLTGASTPSVTQTLTATTWVASFNMGTVDASTHAGTIVVTYADAGAYTIHVAATGQAPEAP